MKFNSAPFFDRLNTTDKLILKTLKQSSCNHSQVISLNNLMIFFTGCVHFIIKIDSGIVYPKLKTYRIVFLFLQWKSLLLPLLIWTKPIKILFLKCLYYKLCKPSYRFIGIVHSKIKISYRFTHPQAIQDVDTFVFIIRTCLENLKLAQQWLLCGEWVPSESVQTADKNIMHK